LDYPRATDAFLKDLRKRITNAKKVVSELDSNYKNADDPMLRSQILASLTTAKDDLSNLQTNMNWYISKPTENDITNANSELALAQAKYDAAKAVLESLEIKAPFDGIVFAVDAQVGETYQAERTLFTIGDPKALEVVAHVTEEDYPHLSVGQSERLFTMIVPESDMYVYGNESRLRQVIVNILENALKFTPINGTISLNIEQTNNEALMIITDSGIGIPAEDLPDLFKRFHRGRNASAYPGNDLGLAIVNAIVTLHHGSINVQSGEQQGTSIAVTLPLLST
jgi:signal transduction histidine kinase